MANCRICGFDPAHYGMSDDMPVKIGRYGGYISLLSCDRCGCTVCSIDAIAGPVQGYNADKWQTLCPDCDRAQQQEAAILWEEEYGDTELENPFLDAETSAQEPEYRASA